MAVFNMLIYVLSLMCLFSMATSDNYLIMFPPELGSQTVALASAATAMIEQNHTVTLLVSHDFASNVKKRMHSDLYSMETYQSSVTAETFTTLQKKLSDSGLKGNYFELIKLSSSFPQLFYQHCEDLFKDQALIHRLEMQKFDLVLAHILLACPVLVAERLDVKFVSLMTAIPPSPFLRKFANPVNPAYSPELMTGLTNQMTFLQRVQNTMVSGVGWLMVDSFYTKYDKLKQLYNIKPEMSIVKSVSQAELLFICSHFTLDFPRAYQPNIISVGGLSAEPSRPLPKDLADFMESSGDAGVLIFSMGSQITAMDTEMANMLADAFAKLPHRIIWKLGGEPPSKTPPNVKLSKWLPQNDLLGHPKTRLLIYHCGLNGVFEAIHHGVPVICIPILADQADNARRLKVKGVSIELDWFSLTSDKIIKAVETFIADDSFKTNMTRLSAIFHDEHLPAAQRLVHWMEKVVRHGGAEHLRPSAAMELNSLQYNLIDVIAFIAVIVFIVLAIVLKLAITCCRCCFTRSSKQKAE